MKIIKITSQIVAEAKNILSKCSSYDKLSESKKKAYDYCSLFNISVCPYCNINHIHVVSAGTNRVSRPDMDHFYCKSQNPKLSLAWRNLIPACMECNRSIKHTQKFSVRKNLHPFFKDFDRYKEFWINLSHPDYINKDNFEICFRNKEDASDFNCLRADNNIKQLSLELRYQFHKKTVLKEFEKIRLYHDSKLNEIEDIIGTTDAVYQHRLENLLTDSLDIEINETPLGKLRKDIAANYLN